MRKFISELRGKPVMTDKGMLLGTVSNFVIETDTGQVNHILITPDESLDTSQYQKDAQGRLAIPFKTLKSVSDVVVVQI